MDWLSRESLWHAHAAPPPPCPVLEADIEADAVVIGAGLTGLTATWALAAAGRRVVVLEAGRVGAGTTGGTSGHLDTLPDGGARKLIRDHGEEHARAMTVARARAIDWIAQRTAEVDDDCGFARVPAYFYTETDAGLSDLAEAETAARKLGIEAERVDNIEAPLPAAGAVRYLHQARVDALALTRGLAAKLRERDVAIYEHSRAAPPKDGDPARVETAGGSVAARDVLLCTHSAYLGISLLDTRIAPYMSYVLAVRLREAFPDALFWDDQEPYHYLRRAADDPRVVIVGGGDHKVGQADEEEAFRKLEAYARARLPVETIERRWAAELWEPDDGLPYAGRVPRSDHRYIATGFSGTGLTMGVATALHLAELVLGRSTALDFLAPARVKPLAAGKEFVSENLNVAKRFVGDRLKPRQLRDVSALQRGTGALVQHEGSDFAAYRDDAGTLHLLKPSCTHAGCYVVWNQADRTWDCPCHGGRYSCTGERLYGPPPTDLQRAAEPEA